MDDEARAVAGSDVAEARRLWQQAGEQYATALQVKPDFHKAASNWGNALLNEVGAVPPQEKKQISLLLSRIEEILLDHTDKAPDLVAYDLACVYSWCGDVVRCLHWLKTCQMHKTLPGCAHVRADRDLDNVRASPEFDAWLRSVCPESGDV